MEGRTERESERRRREEKWQTCWCCRDQRRTSRVSQPSAEKLKHTGPAKKGRVVLVPQSEQLARQARQSRLFQTKKHSHQSRSPDREVKRVKVSKRCTLARERRIGALARRGKGGLHNEGRQVSRRGKASKENLSRRSRKKHERVSGFKSSPIGSGESWFYSKSGRT